MRELPITFKEWKIKVIQEWDFEKQGCMQTRRLIKSKPDIEINGVYFNDYTQKWYWQLFDSPTVADLSINLHYQPGDLLWVKETWGFKLGFRKEDIIEAENKKCLIYKADIKNDIPYSRWQLPAEWKSPMFMYKWAARTWLEVLTVRVEQVQDISYGDCIAEGVYFDGPPLMRDFHSFSPTSRSHINMYRREFIRIWDDIYKNQPQYQWAANPWVERLEIRRKEK